MSKESHDEFVKSVISDPENPVDHDSQPHYEELRGIGEALRDRRIARKQAENFGYHSPKGTPPIPTDEELEAEAEKLWPKKD